MIPIASGIPPGVEEEEEEEEEEKGEDCGGEEWKFRICERNEEERGELGREEGKY